MPDPGAIRAILLDKDGTLTDFRATWEPWLQGAIGALAGEGGVAPEPLADAIGFDPVEGRLRPDALFTAAPADATAAAMASILGWSAQRTRDWMIRRSAGVRQVAAADLVAIFEALRASGRPLGILTNAETAEAEVHLSEMGVRAFLDAVIGCDSGFGVKPAPGGALAFARSIGVEPAGIALVGDSLADMIAARRAGMAAIGVTTGTLDADGLAPHADVVLRDVSLLPGWLSGARESACA